MGFHKFYVEYSGRDISKQQVARLVSDMTRLGWWSRENQKEEYSVFKSPDRTKTIYLFKKENKIVAGWLGIEEFRNPEAIIKWANEPTNERESKDNG